MIQEKYDIYIKFSLIITFYYNVYKNFLNV